MNSEIDRNQHEIDLTRGNLELLRLKMGLLRLMLEQRGTIKDDEYDPRWERYLRHDIGVMENSGRMQGSLKVKIYGG